MPTTTPKTIVTIAASFLALFTAACGGELETEHSWSAPELSYVFADEWREGLATVATVRAFRSFGFVTQVAGDTLFEYQVRRADGRWTSWTPLAFTVGDEIEQRRGHTVVQGPSTAVRLRVRGASAPDLVRLAFHETEQAIRDDDVPQAREAASRTAMAAHWSRWSIPPAIKAYGRKFYSKYYPAYRCSGHLKVGLHRLARWLVSHTKAWTYYGYNCRKIAGTSLLSVHSTGRAIDVMVRPARRYRSGKRAYYPDNANNDKGDPIGNWLIRNARRLGVSYIIWDRTDWGAHRPRHKMAKRYTGVAPHNDHLHIELNPRGAKQRDVPFCRLPGLKTILHTKC